MTWFQLQEELDRLYDNGRIVRLWLRDDDAVMPSPALVRLGEIADRYQTQFVIAVIPSQTGLQLADFLGTSPYLRTAVHGWSHTNHAPPHAKRQELGYRSPTSTLDELSQGLTKLAVLHSDRLVQMLVPPWNRIDLALVPQLPGIGFKFLSTFGHISRTSPIAMVNTHVDLIDWRGTRQGRGHAALLSDLIEAIQHDEPIGILSHHLVNDSSAFDFIEKLLALTVDHLACHWLRW